MKAGKLKHRIVIQQATSTTSAEGMAVPSWSTFATVWAAVEPLMGREALEAQAITPTATTRFRVRYLAGVLPEMRISWNSKYFEIQSVTDQGAAKQEMWLMAKEVVS